VREAGEALFNTDEVLAVSQEMIEHLARRAAESPRGRFRLCLHGSPQESIQEMIVVSRGASYCRPHCHPSSPASVHVIEGEMTFVVFDAEGRVLRKVEMGPRESGRCFCVRIAPGCWHMDVPRPPRVIIHETMAGPFVPGRSNVFAPWSPEEGQTQAVRELLDRVAREGEA